jgi:gamma-glutamylcyclotransferase (GGCT)/AIG2-like uncharacterized protein YtfP
MMDRLPFFVYGTLRPGQGNHQVVEDLLVAVHDAVLDGHVLYEAGLPYIGSCGAEGTVTGNLLVPGPVAYGEALRRLDRLEGFRPPDGGLYLRRACQVRLACGLAAGPAWVYHGGGFFEYEDPALVVPGGDWAAHRAARAGRVAV